MEKDQNNIISYDKGMRKILEKKAIEIMKKYGLTLEDFKSEFSGNFFNLLGMYARVFTPKNMNAEEIFILINYIEMLRGRSNDH
jgi:hypothetical protein